MITSITIKNGETSVKIPSCPSVALSTYNGISTEQDNGSITIGADNSYLYNTDYYKFYRKLVNGEVELPYVTKISGVTGDANNMIWLLGGKTFQVDRAIDGYTPPEDGDYVKPADNVLYISDMGQTVDYPRIYRATYDMLRQIRLWIDAHKDTILLDESNADEWWDVMKTDPDDSKPVPKTSTDSGTLWSLPVFEEPRSRSDITAIGDATNILGNYWATVALWNYIVNQPLSSTTARLHPADDAGIYIGINTHVPRADTSEINLMVAISIEIETDQVDSTNIDDFKLWVRMPIRSCIPNDGNIVFSGLKIANASASQGNTSESILNSGMHLDWTNNLEMSYDVTIPAASSAGESISNIYTIQNVVEVIPYIVCPYDGENNEGTKGLYATSRKSSRLSERGETKWRVVCNIYKNGDSVGSPQTLTKSSAYVQVCEESDSTE